MLKHSYTGYIYVSVRRSLEPNPISLLFSKITPMSIQNKDLNNVCLKQKRKEKENEVIDANIDQKLE